MPNSDRRGTAGSQRVRGDGDPEEEFQDGRPGFVRRARAARRSLLLRSPCGARGCSARHRPPRRTSKRVLLYTGTTGFRHTDAHQQRSSRRPDRARGRRLHGRLGGLHQQRRRARTTATTPTRTRASSPTTNLARYDAIVLLNSSAGPARPAVERRAEGGDHQVRPERRRHRRRPQRDRHGHHGSRRGTGGTATTRTRSSAPRWPATPPPSHDQHRARSRSPTTTTSSTRDLPGHVRVRRRALQLPRATSAARTTCSRRSTSAPTRRAATPWARTTRSRGASSTTATTSTTTPARRRPTRDGRTWVTGMGHFGASVHRERRQQQPGQADRRRRPLGRRRGPQVRLLGHRLVELHAHGPRRRRQQPDRHRRRQGRQGLLVGDRQPDQRSSPTGYIKMHDPAGAAGNKTTVATIPTRADHGNSEDGVLGMSLQPGFDLADPTKRNVFVYYSPRNPDWPTTGNAQVVGYNQISRFTLTADGTAVVPGLRARDPARPQGQDRRHARPASRAARPTPAPATWAAPAWTSTPPATCTSASATTSSPNASGPQRLPADGLPRRRSAGTRARRRPNTADLRGKVAPHQADAGRRSPPDAEPGVGATYTIPAGNLFPVGTAEDPSRDLRDGLPPAVHAAHRPGEPGHRRRRRVLPRQLAPTGADRAPAGTCEWNLLDKPGNHGWPFCVGDNSPANTTFRWNYATQRDDGPAVRLLADARCRPTSATRPTGQTPVAADLRRPGHAARPGRAGDDLEEVRRRRPAARAPADFGDLDAGGMQPIAGPIYRYDEATAGAGRVPALLRRLVADQQPRRRQRLLEGSPAAQGQQRDAARQRLAAVQRGAARPRATQQPRDRHAVRPRRRAVHGPLPGRLLPRRAPTRPARRRSSRSRSTSRTSA